MITQAAFDLGTNCSLHTTFISHPVLHNWCFLAGDGNSSALYDEYAARRVEAIESVLWDAERGAWFDFNLMTHSKRFEFYPSNLAPVWAECYSRPDMAENAVKYLKVGGHLSLHCGLILEIAYFPQFTC